MPKNIPFREWVIERQVIDFYSDIFGLADFSETSDWNALDIVSVNDKEGLYEFGIRHRTIQTFRRYKLSERYGLSLLEFLELPYHMVRSILEIEKENLMMEKQIADQAHSRAEKELKQSGLI